MATINDNITATENAHSFTVEAVAKLLNADLQNGLAESSIDERIKKYGLNNYAEQKQKSVWLILF